MKGRIYYLVVLCSLCLGSCTIFQPLTLTQPGKFESRQHVTAGNLAMFNGDYEIFPTDTSNYNTSAYAFIYSSEFDLRKTAGNGSYVRLLALNERELEATLFVDGVKRKSQKIKGRVSGGFFEFHSNHYSLKWVFIVYRKQTNRITNLESGDLYLDTNSGGIGFLLFLPIPLSGSSIDTYGLAFRRKKPVS